MITKLAGWSAVCTCRIVARSKGDGTGVATWRERDGGLVVHSLNEVVAAGCELV